MANLHSRLRSLINNYLFFSFGVSWFNFQHRSKLQNMKINSFHSSGGHNPSRALRQCEKLWNSLATKCVRNANRIWSRAFTNTHTHSPSLSRSQCWIRCMLAFCTVFGIAMTGIGYWVFVRSIDTYRRPNIYTYMFNGGFFFGPKSFDALWQTDIAIHWLSHQEDNGKCDEPWPKAKCACKDV